MVLNVWVGLNSFGELYVVFDLGKTFTTLFFVIYDMTWNCRQSKNTQKAESIKIHKTWNEKSLKKLYYVIMHMNSTSWKELWELRVRAHGNGNEGKMYWKATEEIG